NPVLAPDRREDVLDRIDFQAEPPLHEPRSRAQEILRAPAVRVLMVHGHPHRSVHLLDDEAGRRTIRIADAQVDHVLSGSDRGRLLVVELVEKEGGEGPEAVGADGGGGRGHGQMLLTRRPRSYGRPAVHLAVGGVPHVSSPRPPDYSAMLIPMSLRASSGG